MDYKELSLKIKIELDQLGRPFSLFQKESTMACPPFCCKCCFNIDITCTPFELLPLAIKLLSEKRAEEMLSLAQSQKGSVCVLLKVIDEKNAKGMCSEYDNRPAICRAFGVSARSNKKNEIELSICKFLKEIYEDENIVFGNKDVPLINNIQWRLDAIDPLMIDSQIPINEALCMILEKVLLWDSYSI